MFTFTSTHENPLQKGLSVLTHDRFGLGVNLDGFHVSVDRHNPAVVTAGKIMAASINTVTPRKGGPFFTLTKSEQEPKAVLVLVSVQGPYDKKGLSGSVNTLEGKPETVKQNGLAYLMILHPGDVILVRPKGGRKVRPYVLFFNEANELDHALHEDWLAGQNVEKATDAEVVYGTMPAISFVGSRDGWELKEGIETINVPAGRALKLGPRDKSWREKHHRLVAVADEFPPVVTRAAIGISGDNFVFVTSPEVEEGKFIVRIDTAGLRRGGYTCANVFKGSPEMITEGWMRHGTANPIEHRDQLWIVGEGDCLRIGQLSQEYPSDYALFVKDGQIKLKNFSEWMHQDAQTHPSFYHEMGLSHPAHLPQDWVGMIVTAYRDYGRELDSSVNTGKLLSADPIQVDSAWDQVNKPAHKTVNGLYQEVKWFQLDTIDPDAMPENVATKDEYRIKEQPFGNGHRFQATLIDPNTIEALFPCHHYRVTTWTVDGETRESEEMVGEVEKLKATSPLYLTLPESGNVQIGGNVTVEFYWPTSGKNRGREYYRIFSPEELTKERLEAEARIEETESDPLRLWGVEMDIDYDTLFYQMGYTVEINGEEVPNVLYGMPMKEDPDTGWMIPCDPKEASQWCVYMRSYNSDNEDDWELVKAKGFRSKSTGRNLKELMRNFLH